MRKGQLLVTVVALTQACGLSFYPRKHSHETPSVGSAWVVVRTRSSVVRVRRASFSIPVCGRGLGEVGSTDRKTGMGLRGVGVRVSRHKEDPRGVARVPLYARRYVVRSGEMSCRWLAIQQPREQGSAEEGRRPLPDEQPVAAPAACMQHGGGRDRTEASGGKAPARASGFERRPDAAMPDGPREDAGLQECRRPLADEQRVGAIPSGPQEGRGANAR